MNTTSTATHTLSLIVGTVLTPDLSPDLAGVTIRNGRIMSLIPRRGPQRDAILAGTTVIDLGEEATLMPGFIDVHTHGGWGER